MGKVFISYSHDSPEHSERVLALSNQLRALGVNVELDRYRVRPPQGWPLWCDEQLRPEVSSFVLVICTPTYRARVENQVGANEGRGVYWEGAILYNYLYNAKGDSRFVPILLDDTPETAIPMPLEGHTRYRVRAFELGDSGFEALYRELTGQPRTPKPELGELVPLGVGDAPRTAKPLPEKQAVTDFPSVGSFWSPFSNEESVERDEVRFWAIVETLAAMAAFWWVAIRYETFLLLTTSLFVAPLLLLRSVESTHLAVKWLDKGMFASGRPDDFLRTEEAGRRVVWRWIWIVFVIAVAVILGLDYVVAELFLAGHAGWSAFGRGVCVGLTFSWLVAVAAQVAFVVMAGAGVVVVPVAAAGLGGAVGLEGHAAAVAFSATVATGGMAIGAASVAVAGALGVAFAGAGVTAVAGVIAGAAVAWAAATGTVVRQTTRLIREETRFFDFFAMAPSTLLGIWLATLTFRFAATARHAREGYRRLPTNVQRLALSMTPLQHPELLPGLQASHPLRFNVYFRELFSGFPRLGRFDVLLFLALFIYLPAWAYRFILKSTLWFWWILFIVGGAPRLDGGIEGMRADAYRKAWPWVGIATALFSLAAFSVNWLAIPFASDFIAGPKLPMAVALLVLVDWRSVPIVTYITIASVLTTFAVGFWTQAVYADSRNPLRATRVSAQLPWLGHLIKWKSGFGAVTIALLMLYVALYANAVHHYAPVSDWAAGWLRWIYGAAAEPLQPA